MEQKLLYKIFLWVIIKGFLPLGFTFIIYALLEKGMKSTTLLWGILILGIVLSFFGIL